MQHTAVLSRRFIEGIWALSNGGGGGGGGGDDGGGPVAVVVGAVLGGGGVVRASIPQFVTNNPSPPT